MECLYDLTTVIFADRTRSKFTIDCCCLMFNFDSSKCCCKVQRTCQQVTWSYIYCRKVFIPWQLSVILSMMEKLYHITYKECQQTVIFITKYKYENHVYWQTVIFALV